MCRIHFGRYLLYSTLSALQLFFLETPCFLPSMTVQMKVPSLFDEMTRQVLRILPRNVPQVRYIPKPSNANPALDALTKYCILGTLSVVHELPFNGVPREPAPRPGPLPAEVEMNMARSGQVLEVPFVHLPGYE